MSGPMIVQTDGLRQFSQTHADIASRVSQLVSGSPSATGVETTHGPIAMAVQSALSDVLGSRTGTLQNTATSGTTISGLLAKAAQMYDDGDRDGAATIRAAVQALADRSQGDPAFGAAGANAGGAAGSAAGAGAGAGAAGQAAGALSQMMGQVGQLGQMGQQASGAMAGMQQVPQQVMQGVQQIVEAASGAGEGQQDTGQPTPSAGEGQQDTGRDV